MGNQTSARRSSSAHPPSIGQPRRRRNTAQLIEEADRILVSASALCCTICYCTMHKHRPPIVLFCGHTLCSLCADGIIEREPIGDGDERPGFWAMFMQPDVAYRKTVQCPLCRKKYKLDASGRLPVNFQLKMVTDGVRESPEPDSPEHETFVKQTLHFNNKSLEDELAHLQQEQRKTHELQESRLYKMKIALCLTVGWLLWRQLCTGQLTLASCGPPVGLACLLVFVFVILASMVKTEPEETSEGASTEGCSTAAPVEVLPLPEINRDDLVFSGALSAGAYGAVFKAKWISRNCVVAVKRVFLLEKEAKILSILRHKNIIQFYGVCSVSPDFGIVTEYAENGSLYDLLANETYDDLSVEHVLEWAMDIAEGIHYLHSQTQTVILHRDLKSKNVVIDSDWVCKLCDFGTSKVSSSQTTKRSHMTVAGTVPWMSPEMISQNALISWGTDIWSYAVVLWELLTREQPFKGLTEYRIATMIVDEGVRLTVPNQCPAALASLINDCWRTKADERPTSTDVVARLRAIANDASISSQTAEFCEDKASWKDEIDEQLALLKMKELELSEREAQLTRREEQLSAREVELLRAHNQSFNSQRQLHDLLAEDVKGWTEESVCLWLSSLQLAGRQEELTVILSKFKEHHINGPRLLLLTDTDLQHMGVVSIGQRRHISHAISELNRAYVRATNFPSLAAAQKQLEQEQSNRVWRSELVNADVLFIIGIHSRQVAGTDKYRWKLYVDADWLEPMGHYASLVSQHDAATGHLRDDAHLLHASQLVQNVTIYVSAPESLRFLSEPIASSTFPFVLDTWLDAPVAHSYNSDSADEDEGLVYRADTASYTNGHSTNIETSLQIVLSFGDIVIQPRNTRFDVSLNDYKRSRVLVERTVRVACRPTALKKKLTGAQYSLSDSDSQPRLLGDWANRSYAEMPSTSSSTSPPHTNTTVARYSPSRAWAEIAAGLRNSQSQSTTSGSSTHHSSYTPESLLDRVRKQSQPTPPPSHLAPPHFRTGSADVYYSPSNSIGQPPVAAAAQTRLVNSAERHYLDLTPSPDVLANGSAAAVVWPEQQELSPVSEHSVGVALPANSSVAGSGLNRNQRRKHNRRSSQNKQLSRMVHGGNQKWAWKAGGK